MPLPCVIQCLTCCIHLPSQVGAPCHTLVSPSALHAAFTSPVKCILYAPLFHPVRCMLHSRPQPSVDSMPLPCLTQCITCCIRLPSQVCTLCRSVVLHSLLHAACPSPVKCVPHATPLFSPVYYMLHSPPQSSVFSIPIPCLSQCNTCCIQLPSRVRTPCVSLV